jgi:hypothetical protein
MSALTKEQVLATTDPPTVGFLAVIDSAEPNDSLAIKYINERYITPEFFFESGTALDMPVAQLQLIVQQSSAAVEAITESPAPVAQKETLLEEVEQVVQAVEEVL